MPFSTTTLLRFTAKLSRYLSLALLPALASEADAVSQPQRKQNVRSAQLSGKASGAMPYLAALGPLPLRFARPGPEPTEEPPVPPEPKVVVPPTENTPAKEPAEKLSAETPALRVPPAEKPVEPESALPEPAAQPALPILPDDTKRELRPEDVLLFFRYPGASPASGETGVQAIVPFTPAQPQSNPLPPSSATYQLK